MRTTLSLCIMTPTRICVVVAGDYTEVMVGFARSVKFGASFDLGLTTVGD